MAKSKKGSPEEKVGWDGLLMAFGIVFLVGAFLFQRRATANFQQLECKCEKEWSPICVRADAPEEYLQQKEMEKQQRMMQEGKSEPAEEDVSGKSAAEQRYKKVSTEDYMLMPYPNECEAVCHGHTDWDEGLCKDSTPTFQCIYENDCPHMDQPGGYEPVCWFGITLPNACYAECAVKDEYKVNFKEADLVPGECTDPCKRNPCKDGRRCLPKVGPCFEPPCFNHKCVDPKCDCKSFEWEPVCAQGITYTNQCYADCEGSQKTTPGACKELDPQFPNPIPFPKPKKGKEKIAAEAQK
jgi:hypothetical protein